MSDGQTVLRRDPPGLAIVREARRMVMSMSGELDMAAESAFGESLDRLGHPAAVCFDLTELRFIDSTGLRLVVMATRRLQEAGTVVTVRIPAHGTTPAGFTKCRTRREAVD